jgi:hypothetical protein
MDWFRGTNDMSQLIRNKRSIGGYDIISSIRVIKHDYGDHIKEDEMNGKCSMREDEKGIQSIRKPVKDTSTSRCAGADSNITIKWIVQT